MSAGLDHAGGDAVVVIDADLQDPPELIPDMIRAWREGHDVVLMRRRSRAQESWLKKATARAFYRAMGRIGTIDIPENVGDFRLLSRRAVAALRRFPERSRFMKGLFAWIGFPCREIEYDRDGRHAGETKWNYWRLWNFALEGHHVVLGRAAQARELHRLRRPRSSRSRYGVYFIVKTLLFGDPVARLSDARRRRAVPGRAAADGARHHRRVPRPHVHRGEAAPALPRAAATCRRHGRSRRRPPPTRAGDMAFRLTARERRVLALFVVAVLAVRLATLGAYPLMDSTEVALRRDRAQDGRDRPTGSCRSSTTACPFWGKPPLSTWLSAASMAAIGVDEFAARLPSFLLLLAGCVPVAWLARTARRPRSGAVDARALRLHRARVRRRRRRDDRSRARARHDACRWPASGSRSPARTGSAQAPAAAFFGGLAIGLLAKGPVAVVLTFLPIGAWTLVTRRWNAAWTRLPWVIGIARDRRVRRAVVLGRRARDAGVPRLFPGRRALEALPRAGLEGRSLRRRARAAARDDLALLDRRRAAVVASRSPGSSGRVARSRDDLRDLAADPWRLYLLLWTVTPMAFFTRVGQHPRHLRAARACRPSRCSWRVLAAGPRRRPPAASRGARRRRRGQRAAALVRRRHRHATRPARIRTFAGGARSRVGIAARRRRPASGLLRARRPHRPISIRAERRRMCRTLRRSLPLLDDPAADFIALRARDLARLPAPTALPARAGRRSSAITGCCAKRRLEPAPPAKAHSAATIPFATPGRAASAAPHRARFGSSPASSSFALRTA